VAGETVSRQNPAMPLYEYRCEGCGHEFEELVFGGETPDCPRCGAAEPHKLMSAHTVGKSRAASPPPPCGSCGHPDGPGACGLG